MVDGGWWMVDGGDDDEGRRMMGEGIIMSIMCNVMNSHAMPVTVQPMSH